MKAHMEILIPTNGLPDQHFWTSLCRSCWLPVAVHGSSGIVDSLGPWQSRLGNGVRHSVAHTVKHLLFTTKTFPATVLTPDKLSEYPQTLALEGAQVQARFWPKPDPGKKDVTANGSRNILKKHLKHHFCYKASFMPSVKQDYPASPFSASCPHLYVSLGILISPRTAFEFINFYVR